MMGKFEKTLDAVATLVSDTTTNISQAAATALVMQEFVDLTLPKLTQAQCAEIHVQLRQVLEDRMSLMDHMTLPANYHSVFLDKASDVLRRLERNIGLGY